MELLISKLILIKTLSITINGLNICADELFNDDKKGVDNFYIILFCISH